MEKSNEYVKEKSYITFNKLYKVKSLNEYMENMGNIFTMVMDIM